MDDCHWIPTGLHPSSITGGRFSLVRQGTSLPAGRISAAPYWSSKLGEPRLLSSHRPSTLPPPYWAGAANIQHCRQTYVLLARHRLTRGITTVGTVDICREMYRFLGPARLCITQASPCVTTGRSTLDRQPFGTIFGRMVACVAVVFLRGQLDSHGELPCSDVMIASS